MIKKIFIKNEKQVMNVLKKGQVVEGRLRIERADDGNGLLRNADLVTGEK